MAPPNSLRSKQLFLNIFTHLSFQVFSVVLFLATIGGIGYLVLNSQRKDSKTIDLEKVDDPISEAERIMDKYR